MPSDTYNLSFTAVDLSLTKSVTLARVYLEHGDWDTVKRKVEQNNILQFRTNSAAHRTFREIVPRLQNLNQEQFWLVANGVYQEQQHMLWLAVCKTYAYIRDFAVEVLREKFLRMDYQLTELDYISFFNQKADWHPELESITDSTQNKVKQIMFRMARQAELVTEENTIQAIIFSEREKEALKPDAPLSFQIFPTMIPEDKANKTHE